jgi:hypothetical protein
MGMGLRYPRPAHNSARRWQARLPSRKPVPSDVMTGHGSAASPGPARPGPARPGPARKEGIRRGGTRAMIANWPLIGRQEELSLIERTLSDGQFRGLLLAGAPGGGQDPGWLAKRSPPRRPRGVSRSGLPPLGRWPRSRSVLWRSAEDCEHPVEPIGPHAAMVAPFVAVGIDGVRSGRLVSIPNPSSAGSDLGILHSFRSETLLLS